MRRLARRLVVAVVVLAVLGGAAVLVLNGRDRLDAARDDVDAAWLPLRASLAARYDKLDAVAKLLAGAGAGDRTVSKDLTAALDRWRALRARSGVDVRTEAALSNELEGLLARVRTTVAGSLRLQGVAGLGDAVNAVVAATPAEPAVRAYDDAAARYEDERRRLLRRPVVSVFDYPSRPALLLARAA